MSSYANALTEYSPQMETFEFGQSETFGETTGGVFNEQQELELAAELLEVSNEQELDRFLGDLIRKVGSSVGQIANSTAGKASGGVLKTVAKQALPIAGGALGAWVGGPIGARIGSGLASMAGQALGLELEGLSQEDREFEATKQFVRFAGDAVKNTLTSSPAEMRGRDALVRAVELAKAAAAESARVHAPGLLQTQPSKGGQGSPNRNGKWQRQGKNIVIFGV